MIQLLIVPLILSSWQVLRDILNKERNKYWEIWRRHCDNLPLSFILICPQCSTSRPWRKGGGGRFFISDAHYMRSGQSGRSILVTIEQEQLRGSDMKIDRKHKPEESAFKDEKQQICCCIWSGMFYDDRHVDLELSGRICFCFCLWCWELPFRRLQCLD